MQKLHMEKKQCQMKHNLKVLENKILLELHHVHQIYIQMVQMSHLHRDKIDASASVDSSSIARPTGGASAKARATATGDPTARARVIATGGASAKDRVTVNATGNANARARARATAYSHCNWK